MKTRLYAYLQAPKTLCPYLAKRKRAADELGVVILTENDGFLFTEKSGLTVIINKVDFFDCWEIIRPLNVEEGFDHYVGVESVS